MWRDRYNNLSREVLDISREDVIVAGERPDAGGGREEPADTKAVAALIDAYIEAGGPPETAALRAGMPAANWALGWHRIWISDWYAAEQVERGWAGDEVTAWTDTISRHLNEAIALLAT